MQIPNDLSIMTARNHKRCIPLQLLSLGLVATYTWSFCGTLALVCRAVWPDTRRRRLWHSVVFSVPCHRDGVCSTLTHCWPPTWTLSQSPRWSIYLSEMQQSIMTLYMLMKVARSISELHVVIINIKGFWAAAKGPPVKFQILKEIIDTVFAC